MRLEFVNSDENRNSGVKHRLTDVQQFIMFPAMRDVDDVVSTNWVFLIIYIHIFFLLVIYRVLSLWCVCVCICVSYFFFHPLSVLFKFSIITTCMFDYVFSYDGDYGCWLGVEKLLFETMTRKVLRCSCRYWMVLSL